MPTVFFSWQSDRGNREKNFIEKALEIAVKQISNDLQVDENARDPLELDRDTKGIPGSPKIFDTILVKIERAAVFIADLTFVGSRPKGEPSPNPNVLIEYGYALKCLSSARIVGVMNETSGKPSRETLPLLTIPCGDLNNSALNSASVCCASSLFALLYYFSYRPLAVSQRSTYTSPPDAAT